MFILLGSLFRDWFKYLFSGGKYLNLGYFFGLFSFCRACNSAEDLEDQPIVFPPEELCDQLIVHTPPEPTSGAPSSDTEILLAEVRKVLDDLPMTSVDELGTGSAEGVESRPGQFRLQACPPRPLCQGAPSGTHAGVHGRRY